MNKFTKKVLTKKLSSTVILLILLALGVFAVVFNRFYINSSAKLYNSGDPTQETGRSGGGLFVACCSAKQRRLGYTCVNNNCVAPKPLRSPQGIDLLLGSTCLKPNATICGTKGSGYEDYVYTCSAVTEKFEKGAKCELGCIGNGICNQTCPTDKVFDRLHGGCMDKKDFVSCTGNYTKSSSNCSTTQFDNDKNSIWCETPVTGEILFCCKAGFTKSDRAGNGGVMCI